MAAWEQAMVTLVRDRGGALKRYAFLLCGNDADADDLVQEALVRAFARPGRRDGDQVEAYVRRIMLNKFLDSTRRHRIWSKAMPLLSGDPVVPDQAGSVAARADVRTALAALPPQQRACAVLRYYEDLTVPQIAALLGCRAGTVKRYLSEAHGRLGDVLGQGEEESGGKPRGADLPAADRVGR